MKKLVNWFKQLDQTKKIVISFITISFAFIIGLTCYNGLNGNFENQEKNQIVQIEDNKEKKSQKEKQNEEKNKQNDDSNDSQKQKENNEVNQTDEKETSPNQKQQDNPNKEKNTNQDQPNTTTDNQDIEPTPAPKIETVHVKVQVIGMGSTMMSGNLTVEKGSNAYDVLKTLASQNGISISTSGFGTMVYVIGIGDLYEKQHGNMSGWMYRVNGTSPNVGAGSYKLNDGDSVVWYYANYE